MAQRLLRSRRVVFGGFILVIIAATTIWLAGSFLSTPANHPVGNPPSDLQATAVQFPSESGSTIHGWFIPGNKGGGAVLLLHGVRGSRLAMLDRARFLSQAGYSVLLIDFQAHGESSGRQITFGYLESRDARAAIEVLRANAPGEKIGVIGISLGGAAAALAAPPLQVDAIVFEMVYPTIDEAVGDRLAMRFGSWSRVFTPLLTWQLRPRLGVSARELRPIDHMGSLPAPKLFIVGSADRHTTLAESQVLFAAAAEPKELWVVEGAQHQDLYVFSRQEYERRVLGFFGQNLR